MRRTSSLFFLLALSLSLWSGEAFGQRLGIKTNLLYDATASLNAGLEIGLGKRMSLDLTGQYNGIDFSSSKKWKHWMVQPELRYWTCTRMSGHFFGLHGLYVDYNAGGVRLPFGLSPGLRNHRYQGHAYGGGLSYGYHWVLGKRWGLEASVGAGYLRADYTKYQCGKCGEEIGKYTKNYFGPTKLGLSVIYLLK